MGCNIKRIIRLTDAIQTTPIQIIDNGVDRTNQCLFSWSNDGVCWTGWSSYSEYLRITQYIELLFIYTMYLLLRMGIG